MNRSPNILSPPTTLREKLAQLMMVRIGSNLPPVRKAAQDADRIAALLEECPVGGLIVFNGDAQQTPAALEKLQTLSTQPLLVAADIERGVGQQLHGQELFPHALAFEALGGDAEQAVEEFARLSAIDARARGLHITFSPVADVNVDPKNPIIATRAFGSDPQRVAQLVAAFVRGSRAGGLLSTAKHFPGHGNTHEDSHHAVPTVRATRNEMEQCELVPFQAAISAGVPLVMSAHVRYPSWDDTGAPATLSHPLLVDLLRGQLGFEGAVVSDSLLMEGVKSRHATEGELAVAALLAGIDILLDVAEPCETLAALEQAVADGRLPVARVEAAFARVWRLKQKAFDSPTPTVDSVVTEQAGQLSRRVAIDSIQCFTAARTQLPFERSKQLCAILVRPYESPFDAPEQPLGPALRALAPESLFRELGPGSSDEEYQQLLSQVQSVEQVLIAVIVKPAAWHAFGLLPKQATFVEQLTQQQACVLASLGTPEVLNDFPQATVKLCTFSDVPVSQQALATYCLATKH